MRLAHKIFFIQVCVTDSRTWRPIRIFLFEKDNRNFPGIAGVLRFVWESFHFL